VRRGSESLKTLEMRGVNIQLERHVPIEQIEEYEEGLRVSGACASAIEADLVLMATGRKPNLEGLGLGDLGIDDTLISQSG